MSRRLYLAYRRFFGGRGFTQFRLIKNRVVSRESPKPNSNANATNTAYVSAEFSAACTSTPKYNPMNPPIENAK